MKRRPCWCAWLFVVFSASIAAADEGDPLRSADCRRALDALQAQEREVAAAAAAHPSAHADAPGPRRAVVAAPLATARRQAAYACLGSRADAPRPLPQSVQPPIVVAPVATPAPLPPSVSTGTARPVGPPPLSRPVAPPTVTHCDAVGCWASDGSRWHRAGPGLVGPGGLCSGVPGATLHCP